jgi:multiple sugar transport system substrate-binding protein
MSTYHLKGMTWDHPRGLDCLVNSDGLLQKQLQVSVEWSARSLLAFGDQHISEFYAEHDLMIIDHPHVPDAVHAGAVIALEDVASADDMALLAKTSVGASHDSYIYKGKHWALAIDTAAQVSAYRPDKTSKGLVFWEEVLAAGREGLVLWPHKPVDAFSTFATIMAQQGHSLCSGSEYIDKAVAAEVLAFMIELAKVVPAQCLSMNPIEAAEYLVTTDKEHYSVCMYGYTNYSRDGFRTRPIIYDDVPSFDGLASGSQLGGAGIAISSATKNVELAAKVAILLSLPEIQSTTYVDAGGQPGNLAAWKAPHANAITRNFFNNTLRTLERAWVRPRFLGWPDVQFQSSLIIHNILKEKNFSVKDIDAIAATYTSYNQELTK